MKRIYWLLLVLGIALLAGCGKKDTAAEQKEEKVEEKEAEAETEGETETKETEAANDSETVAEAEDEAGSYIAEENVVSFKDLSEVVDQNLTVTEAAKKMGLIFETVDEDDTHYFYKNEACDSSEGMLWCDGYQYEDPNNWSYSPGDTDVTIYGIKRGMTKEEVIAAMSDPVWEDVTDYFGMAEAGDFYYKNTENDFIVNGLYYEGAVDNVSAFCGKDY